METWASCKMRRQPITSTGLRTVPIGRGSHPGDSGIMPKVHHASPERTQASQTIGSCIETTAMYGSYHTLAGQLANFYPLLTPPFGCPESTDKPRKSRVKSEQKLLNCSMLTGQGSYQQCAVRGRTFWIPLAMSSKCSLVSGDLQAIGVGRAKVFSLGKPYSSAYSLWHTKRLYVIQT